MPKNTKDKPIFKHFSRFSNGFAIVFDNGWLVDASFGKGNYAGNYREYEENDEDIFILQSESCETIVMDAAGNDKTYEVGVKLGIGVSGTGFDAVMAHLSLDSWLRVLEYVKKIK